VEKPQSKTNRYRNLYVPASRGTIHYARMIGGKRVVVDTKCPATLDGYRDAAAFRDLYESRKAIDKPQAAYGAVPTFSELVPAYFDSRKFHAMAVTTQQDRRYHLSPDGPVLTTLADVPVDELTADTLVDWWEHQAKAREWSSQTGFRYLSTISEVLKIGRKHLNGRVLPTVEARQRLGEQRRTAAGRAEVGAHVQPIESPAALDKLLEAARAEGVEVAAFLTAQLDAGLRRGEGLALRWRCIAWGADEDDPRRHLVIEASRSRTTNEDGRTKSGRDRRVGLSRRLRAALGELYMTRDPRPGRDDRVFPSLDAQALRVTWPKITARAELPGVRLKDLRDTFASHLLTLGVPIQFVSRQLGHGGIQVTQTHYARYIGSGGDDFTYVSPPQLAPGEVPADLLARIADCYQIANAGDPFALPSDLAELDKVQESLEESSRYDLPGPLAQLVEHRTFNPRVQGSSP
jgi:integrase